jgi:anti-anti-sigma factor
MTPGSRPSARGALQSRGARVDANGDAAGRRAGAATWATPPDLPRDDLAFAAPRLAVRVRLDGDLGHVEPVGELDIASAGQLGAVLADLAGRVDRFAIDLRGLEFIDSQGVRLLVGFEREARRNGWALSLVQGPDVVSRIFALTGTLDLLPFVASTADEVPRR